MTIPYKSLSPKFSKGDLAVVLVAMVYPTLATFLYFVWTAGQETGVQQWVYTLCKILQFSFPLFWVFAVQHDKLEIRIGKATALLWGIGFGILAMLVFFLLYHFWFVPSVYFQTTSEAIQQKVLSFGVDRLWKYLAMGAFYSVIHSLLEEYYWRWFVFGQLRRFTPLKLAIVISSVAFTAHHIILLQTFLGWSWPVLLISLFIAVGGIFWAWLYNKSGSLLGPWLSHLLVDVSIFLIGFLLAKASLGF